MDGSVRFIFSNFECGLRITYTRQQHGNTPVYMLVGIKMDPVMYCIRIKASGLFGRPIRCDGETEDKKEPGAS